MKYKEIKPKERGILFSSEMVRAILDDRKTETRRILKRPIMDVAINKRMVLEPILRKNGIFFNYWGKEYRAKCPYGKPGDILYVRETFFIVKDVGVGYKADYSEKLSSAYNWKPSIHMPKKFSRIKLKIKEIRIEKVRDITMRSAIDEGSFCIDTELVMPGYLEKTRIAGLRNENPPIGPNAIERFKYLWDSLNEKRGLGWDKDPFVWVIKFERLK